MDFDQLNVTRKTAPIRLEGFDVKSLNPFFEELIKRRSSPPWIFSDLTLGAWRSFQVPYEFALQLGIVKSVFPKKNEKREEQNAIAKNFGKYVDRETLGDFTIIKSLDITNRIIAEIRKSHHPTFVIFAPNFGFDWERENITFIQFFYNALRGFGDIVLVSTEPDKVKIPNNWKIKWNKISNGETNYNFNIVHMIPGIITPEVNKKIENPADGILALNDGFSIVSPECRKNPFNVSTENWLEFKTKFAREEWLKSYFRFFSDSEKFPNMDIFETVGKLLNEGGNGIALKILEKECSKEIPDELKIILKIFLQGVRIALEKFEKLDEMEDLPQNSPPEYKSFLLMSKGWGKVMTNRLEEAEPYFAKARNFIQNLSEHEQQFLWLLNISALNRFKLGDVDAALNMEKIIEKKNDSLISKDWQLEYINSINLARVYRKKNDTSLSKKYFIRAFNTANGISSESDHLYRNFCLARHDLEAQKLWDALKGWIRIGLHWSSLDVPEAIGRRVVSAIVNRRITNNENVVDEVSNAIQNNILKILQILNFDDTISYLKSLDFQVSAPVFARPHQQTGEINAKYAYEAFLGHGWSIIADSNIRNPQIDNRSYDDLRHLLYGLIKKTYSNDSLNNLQSIIIDDQLGYEIPSNVFQLLETCLRLNVPKITVGDMTVNLQDRQKDLEANLIVSIRECVNSIKFQDETAVVEFKRYLPELMQFNEAAQIIKVINKEPLTVKSLHQEHFSSLSEEQLMKILREMEKAKIAKFGINELEYSELLELDVNSIKKFS